MKSLIVPCVAVLVLASACAQQSKTPRAKKGVASADTAIAPSDAAGLYLDSAKADDFAKTGHVSEADCRESSDLREPAVKVFQFAKDNSVAALDPQGQPGDVYYSFDHGALIPQKDELKSTADRAFSYSIRRKAGKVRVHFAAKDLKTGKISESDQPLAPITEASAKDFLAQEYACAQRPVDSARLTKLALGSALLSYEAAGARSAKALNLKARSAQSLSCEATADGIKVNIGNDVKFQLSAAALDGTKRPLEQAEIAFDGQKLDIVCEASVKRSGSVVDGTLDCGNSGAGHLSGSFACVREANGERK